MSILKVKEGKWIHDGKSSFLPSLCLTVQEASGATRLVPFLLPKRVSALQQHCFRNWSDIGNVRRNQDTRTASHCNGCRCRGNLDVFQNILQFPGKASYVLGKTVAQLERVGQIHEEVYSLLQTYECVP